MADPKPTPLVNRQGNILIWQSWWSWYVNRWVVIANGQAEFYENKAARPYTSCGTVNLENATIESDGNNRITIDCGGIKTFYLCASSREDRESWLRSLKSAQEEAKEAAEKGQDIEVSLVKAEQNQSQLDTDLAEIEKDRDQVNKYAQKLITMAHMNPVSGASEAMPQFNAVRETSQVLGVYSTKMVKELDNIYERLYSQVNHLKSLTKHSFVLWMHYLGKDNEENENESQDPQTRLHEVVIEQSTSCGVADVENDYDLSVPHTGESARNYLM